MKTYIKIAIITLMFGWIPILILPQIDSIPENYKIAGTVLGIGLLSMGIIMVNIFMLDPIWWKTQEQLEEIKESYEKDILRTQRYLEAVKRVAANAQGFTGKEIDKRVKNLEGNNWKPNS